MKEKKLTKLKKKTEIGSNRPVSVQFFGQKQVQPDFAWFFLFDLI